MANALDTFRAQREAADGIYARLTEVSLLLRDLRGLLMRWRATMS